jgi:fused signal recognition particle receptor
MEELRKIGRIIAREASEAHVERLLVVDAGTGQNAISQAKTFGEVVELSGVILTKLDGTAKGGAICGIVNESKLPVRMIGVGEGIEDLQPFMAEDFAQALFK